MQRRLAIAFVVATIAAMAGACNNVTNPSQNTIENFQGTVQPAGAGPLHTFNANNNGEFTVVFTALNPVPAAGVTFGQILQNQCGLIAQQVGSVGQAVFSSSINKGTYCLQVSDVVNTVQFTYTLKVSHP